MTFVCVCVCVGGGVVGWLVDWLVGWLVAVWGKHALQLQFYNEYDVTISMLSFQWLHNSKPARSIALDIKHGLHKYLTCGIMFIKS